MDRLCTEVSRCVPGVALLLLACGIAFGQECQPGELRVLVKDSQEASIYDAKGLVGSD
jgi:hypothetical protein